MFKLRAANAADLSRIHAIETTCFSEDAQTRRSLQYLLTRANARTLVALRKGETHGELLGYTTILFRRNSRVARLYSISVVPAMRRYKLAEALVQAGERYAVEAAGAHWMRLEVRISNHASRRLFATLGYQDCGSLPGYYPNGEHGIRMQKVLVATTHPEDSTRG